MERSGTWQTDKHLPRLKAAVNLLCMKDRGEDDEAGTERMVREGQRGHLIMPMLWRNLNPRKRILPCFEKSWRNPMGGCEVTLTVIERKQSEGGKIKIKKNHLGTYYNVSA